MAPARERGPALLLLPAEARVGGSGSRGRLGQYAERVLFKTMIVI